VLSAVRQRLTLPKYITGTMGFEDGALAIWTSEEDFDNEIILHLKTCHINICVLGATEN
jgi:hypothetical protein